MTPLPPTSPEKELRSDHFNVNMPPSLKGNLKKAETGKYSCRRCHNEVDIGKDSFSKFMLVPDVRILEGVIRLFVFCGSCGLTLQQVHTKFMAEKPNSIRSLDVRRG